MIIIGGKVVECQIQLDHIPELAKRSIRRGRGMRPVVTSSSNLLRGHADVLRGASTRDRPRTGRSRWDLGTLHANLRSLKALMPGLFLSGSELAPDLCRDLKALLPPAQTSRFHHLLG